MEQELRFWKSVPALNLANCIVLPNDSILCLNIQIMIFQYSSLAILWVELTKWIFWRGKVKKWKRGERVLLSVGRNDKKIFLGKEKSVKTICRSPSADAYLRLKIISNFSWIPIIFSNLNYNCSYLWDMRNLQEKV